IGMVTGQPSPRRKNLFEGEFLRRLFIRNRHKQQSAISGQYVRTQEEPLSQMCAVAARSGRSPTKTPASSQIQKDGTMAHPLDRSSAGSLSWIVAIALL